MKNFTLAFRCVFCQSPDFVLPYEGYTPEHGEMVTCANCGRENDYSSLYEVAKEEGIDIVKNAINDMLKDAFKGNKIF